MKSSIEAIALSLAAATLPATIAAAPAAAQDEAAQQPQITLSEGAKPTIAPLQAAVDANDFSNFDALYAAAVPNATTPDDIYYLNVLKLRAGIAQDDAKMQGEAMLAMIDSGYGDPARFADDLRTLGSKNVQADNAALALRLLEASDRLAPNVANTAVLLAEAQMKAGQGQQAFTSFQKAIRLQRASGQTPGNNWYRRALQAAQENDLAIPPSLLILWAGDHGSAENWRTALRLYGDGSPFSDAELIDLWRLQRSASALVSELEYVAFSDELYEAGYPGEALAVLEEGIAAGVLDTSKPQMAARLERVRGSAAGDRDGLSGQASQARAAAEARRAIATGDVYYGYDDFTNAADLYRVALTKQGVDTGLVNLRLGAALARAGQFADAKAALGQVEGKYGDLAKFWMAWIDSQA